MSAIIKSYRDWKLGSLAIGCMFARTIARRPKDYGQIIQVVDASSSPGRIAKSIDDRVNRLIDDPTAVAAALLFPKIPSLEEFSRGLLALTNRPGWNVTTNLVTYDGLGEIVTVGISKQIPFTAADVLPSELLAVGPFDEFPNTRRAPVPAIEIFVGPPMANDPKTGEPSKKANLAHMEMKFPSQNAFLSMWDKSVRGRAKSLGDDKDPRAKAKVAFSMPVALARKLGVA